MNDELERPRDEDDDEDEDEEEDEEGREEEGRILRAQRRRFLHIGYEFEHWRQDRQRLRRRGREGGREGGQEAFEPRTIVFYPFLLTPAVKARLLHFDCVEQMRR